MLKAEPFPADLEVLIDRYGDRILQYCYLYLLDLKQAKEVIEDIFAQAYIHPDFSAHKFNEVKLFRIVVRQCRKCSLQQTQCTISAEKPISSVLFHMTSMERETVLLRYHEGFELKELASISGFPVFVIKHFLSAGDHLLKRCSRDALTD